MGVLLVIVIVFTILVERICVYKKKIHQNTINNQQIIIANLIKLHVQALSNTHTPK